ncbi:MAG: hypothetical protein AAB772_01850 [Patescibacteria group bacterium]
MDLRLPQKQAPAAEVDRSLIKIIVLAFLFVGFAAGLSFFLRQLFYNFDLLNPNYIQLFIFLGVLTGFLSFFSFLPIVIKNFRFLLFAILLGVLGLGSFFYDKAISQPIFFAVIAGVTVLLFLVGVLRERYEYANMMKVRLHRLLAVFLPKIITGLIIFSIAVFYMDFFITGSFFVSEAGFKNILFWSFDPVSRFLPVDWRFVLDQNIGDVLEKLASRQVESDELAAAAPADVKTLLIRQTVDGLLKRSSAFLGIQIDSKSAVSEILYRAAKENFDKAPDLVKNIIAISFFFSLFLLLRGLSIPLVWLVNILSFIIFEILLATLFMAILYESRSREVVVL